MKDARLTAKTAIITSPDGSSRSEAAGVRKPKRASEAKVRVALEERLGIPNSYSSTSIRVEIEYSVKNDPELIKRTAKLAWQQATDFLDSHMDEAVAGVRMHIDRIGGSR